VGASAGWIPDAHIPEQPATSAVVRFFGALRRYKWVALAVTLLFSAAGVVASRLVAPSYDVFAVLWIENTSRNEGPIRSEQLLQSSGWIDLLRSYAVMDEVVQEMRLYLGVRQTDRDAFENFKLRESIAPGRYQLKVSPAGDTYTLYRGDAEAVETRSVAEPVGSELGWSWQPGRAHLTAGRIIDFSVNNPRDAATGLINSVQPNIAWESNLMRLTMTGPDPRATAAQLNAVANRLVEVAAEMKRGQYDELTVALEEQRQSAEETLQTAELALEQFSTMTATMPAGAAVSSGPAGAVGSGGTTDPVTARYLAMQLDLERFQNDRASIERILVDARSRGLPLDALAMVESVQSSTSLRTAIEEYQTRKAERRALLDRYTEDHPSVVRADRTISDLETVTIPQLANELVAQLADRERDLAGRSATASAQLRAVPSRQLELARLQRQVAIASELYGTLEQRRDQARVASASTIPDIRVLDPAVAPTGPTSNRQLLVILMGIMGGLGISVVGVFLADRFDPRVRYPEEVTRGMGLSVLGVLPYIRKRNSKAGAQATLQAAEAFREIRLNLASAHGTAGPVTVTITSPSPGDGKSFVSSNLAFAFGNDGRRTILIDGDIRRGVLHRRLRSDRTPGLTDYLAGEVSLTDVVRDTDDPNVFFIPTGTRRVNAPELLGSAAMGKLLLELRNHFDAIIIDSPPLGAGVDAYVLGTHTRDMMMVLRTGTTDRSLANAKLAMLDRLPIRMLGAVLNATPTMTGTYRYYSYAPGYEIEASADEVKLLVGEPG
jgi:capsular exopolysaccharide synthesis family protein